MEKFAPLECAGLAALFYYSCFYWARDKGNKQSGEFSNLRIPG
jgi:hypothetical protein